MGARVSLLPEWLQVLHTTGIFDHHRVGFIVFLVQIGVVCACLVLLGLALVVLERVLHKGSLRACSRVAWVAGFVGFVCAAVIVSLSGIVVARLCFGFGYVNYLNLQDDRAARYYTFASMVDPSFRRPIEEMVRLFDAGKTESFGIGAISQAVSRSRDPDLSATFAAVLERSGDVVGALQYYEFAARARPTASAFVGIARCEASLGNTERAAGSAFSALALVPAKAEQAEAYRIQSQTEQDRGRLEKALSYAELAVEADPESTKCLLRRANASWALGLGDAALSDVTAAIGFHRTLPEAYSIVGRIYAARGSQALAVEAFRRAVYYDNTDVASFVTAETLGSRADADLSRIAATLPVEILLSRDQIMLSVGETASVQVEYRIADPKQAESIKVATLTPFGFGVVADQEIGPEETANRSQKRSVTVHLRAMRDNGVNLGKPWKIIVVAYDSHSGAFASRALTVSVAPPPDEEGRILYVVTEDLEQSGDFPHSDNTPDINDISRNEIKVDLVEKPALADRIAQEYGIRWTHMVDVGSVVLRLRWLESLLSGTAWGELWGQVRSRLAQSFGAGHDVQLHLHAYNDPGNRLTRIYYDRTADALLFRDNEVRVAGADGRHGAWSRNYDSLGTPSDAETLSGSVSRGLREIGDAIGVDPSTRVLAFRAGEYEFGDEGVPSRRSITALQQNGILVDSDAAVGLPSEKGFIFHRRVGDNVYFSDVDSIWRTASQLSQIGLLEVLPIPTRTASNYVTPIDHGSQVAHSYDLCMSNGRVKSGVFILVEMYHIGNTNSGGVWDNLDPQYGDWAKMARHFAFVRSRCPRAEPVGLGEAATIYLRRYTPDLVPLIIGPPDVSNGTYDYRVEFLGDDILVDDKHPHFVAIRPPAVLERGTSKIELLHGEHLVGSWVGVEGNRDLQFTATNRSGYTLRVYAR
jgi:tetratricopeptide (TPR) repeat protein